MSSEFVPYEMMVDLKNNGYDETAIVNKSYVHTNTGSDIYARNPILLQQAFKWFRNKGYLISFDTSTETEYEYYIVYGGKKKSVLSNIYTTYEEMELQCLSKLIELHKQSNIIESYQSV